MSQPVNNTLVCRHVPDRRTARRAAPVTRRVAVFARRAVAGRVKTRLSPALPPALACALHASMTADTLAAVAATDAERFILWDVPAPDGAGMSATVAMPIAVPSDVREGTQHGDGLGARLVTAFDALLSDAGAAVIVGTDCPDLRPRHIEAALAALAHHDLVLGPSRDGGYWLIGLSRRVPELFADIPWGTDAVFARTVERAAGANLRATRLEMLADVDTPEDLVRLVARWLVVPATQRAPETARALAAMGLLPRS